MDQAISGEAASAPRTQHTAHTGTWMNVAVGGLLTIVIGMIAVMVINEAVIPPLVVMGLISSGLAAAAWRWGSKRWVAFVTAALAAAFVLVNLQFVVEDLSHPETFFSFFPGVVLLAAATVVAIAGVAAGTRRPAGAAVPLIGVAAAGVTAALGISLVATLGVDSDERVAGDVVVTASGTDYPETIEATAGTFGIYIENEDRTRHTFVVEDQGIKQELPGGASRRIEVNLPAGTYRFFCDVPGHESFMEGVLTVR